MLASGATENAFALCLTLRTEACTSCTEANRYCVFLRLRGSQSGSAGLRFDLCRWQPQLICNACGAKRVGSAGRSCFQYSVCAMSLSRDGGAAPAYAATSHDGTGQLMALNREISAALVARVRNKGHKTPQVLDIASGSGEPACTIAHMLPSAQVVSLIRVAAFACPHCVPMTCRDRLYAVVIQQARACCQCEDAPC